MKSESAHRSIWRMGAMLALVVVPQLSEAEGLTPLLFLDFTGEQVVEEFRAADFTVELQRQVLPETLWQSRIVLNPEEGHNGLPRVVYTALSLQDDGSWALDKETYESPGLVVLSKSDALIASEHGSGFKLPSRLPAGCKLLELSGDNSSRVEIVWRAPAGGPIVIRRLDGLYLQKQQGAPEIRLSAFRAGNVKFSSGANPRFITDFRDPGPAGRMRKLVVFNDDGSVAYEEANWRTNDYMGRYFDSSAEYVFLVEDGAEGDDPLVFTTSVIRIATGELLTSPTSLPIGFHPCTDDWTLLLALHPRVEGGPRSAVSLYSLESAPELPRLWSLDLPVPLLEGAIAPGGGSIVLRAEVSSEESELWVMNRDGRVTQTGQFWANVMTGINILPDGIVVTGARMSNRYAISDGRIAIYRISELRE